MITRKIVISLILTACLATADVAVFAVEDPVGSPEGTIASEEQVDPDGTSRDMAVIEEPTSEIQEPVPEIQQSSGDSRNIVMLPQSETTSTTQSTSKPTTTTSTTQKTQPTTKAVKKKLPVVKRFVFSGWNTTFKNKVNRNAYLPSTTIPQDLKLKANRNNIKLTWKRPKGIKSIDGYIVLKKTGTSNRYYEYTRISKKKTSYIDKKAKKKNTKYAYMIVGYKKGSAIRISTSATPWVVGYTTASKKKNLYATSILNAKTIATLRVGAVTKATAKVPVDTAHKYLRWYSSNSKVVKIDDSGTIRAIAPGTVTISVRTATGRVTSTKITVLKPAPKPSMLAIMKSWVGFSEKNKKHRKIIDIYNSYLPHPRNYKMRYSDAWCDACISAAAVASGNVEAVGMECGVPSHIRIFKKKGIWIEDGSITPRAGDIIVFAWGRSKQPNDASGSHIGIVESVSNGKITTIEGNYRDMVTRRTIKVGNGYIRGFARPNYVK